MEQAKKKSSSNARMLCQSMFLKILARAKKNEILQKQPKFIPFLVFESHQNDIFDKIMHKLF